MSSEGLCTSFLQPPKELLGPVPEDGSGELHLESCRHEFHFELGTSEFHKTLVLNEVLGSCG